MLNRVFTAFRMCLGTYTLIQTPGFEPDEDLRRVSDAFLPAVGLLIGLVWWALAAVCRWMLPELLGAALVAAFPFVITGFVHLQGFLAGTEKLLAGKNKAVSVGAALPALLVVLQFACCSSLERIFPLAMIPVLSRVCMALRLFAPKMQDEEGEEEIPASLIRIEKYIAAAALVLMLLFSDWMGLLAGGVVLGVWTLCMKKHTGTQSENMGFALTAAELCALAVLAVV